MNDVTAKNGKKKPNRKMVTKYISIPYFRDEMNVYRARVQFKRRAYITVRISEDEGSETFPMNMYNAFRCKEIVFYQNGYIAILYTVTYLIKIMPFISVFGRIIKQSCTIGLKSDSMYGMTDMWLKEPIKCNNAYNWILLKHSLQ